MNVLSMDPTNWVIKVMIMIDCTLEKIQGHVFNKHCRMLNFLGVKNAYFENIFNLSFIIYLTRFKFNYEKKINIYLLVLYRYSRHIRYV